MWSHRKHRLGAVGMICKELASLLLMCKRTAFSPETSFFPISPLFEGRGDNTAINFFMQLLLCPIVLPHLAEQRGWRERHLKRVCCLLFCTSKAMWSCQQQKRVRQKEIGYRNNPSIANRETGVKGISVE